MRIESGALAYVRTLEDAMVAGARARRASRLQDRVQTTACDFTGVWVEDRKIASIGVHVQRGVTTHGFAVNVDADLEPFEWIVPCGLGGVRMTSIATERGAADMACFRKRMAHRFADGDRAAASGWSAAPAF